MGWPDNGQYTVRTLGTNTTGLVGDVKKVTLLGNSGNLTFQRTADGLVVALPANKPCDCAYVLKIEGIDLAKSIPVLPPPALVGIKANPAGAFILLPEAADLQGGLQVEHDPANIVYWNDAGDTASWLVHFDAPGTYSVAADISSPGAASIIVTAGDAKSDPIAIASTGDFGVYNVGTGSIRVRAAGDVPVVVKPADRATWQAINMRTVVLTKTN
jgi:alpha-L-fucosidase